ncbi:protein TIFY 6B-like isoform X2 [Cornus florida]|uniref:protein TIFY 6B-like isoform X2 n=1 Tax=Cornus florida TaxID=4283 RepID=UPI0028A2678F|nr:protein TIFY 6B-like isoform X2 [Cornus florida]
MERDFLGLSSKESVITVKEEVVEGCIDSGVPWPLSNKASALPHFMFFKTAQEDKTAKILSNHIASSGLMTISTADAFDAAHKRPSGELQKNCNQDKQGGTHFSMTSYPAQQNAHSLHLSHDVKELPVSGQTISVSMNHPFFKTHFTGSGQNFLGATTKQHLFGGIPVTAPHSALPSLGSVAGINEPRFNSKASGGAQLTIFYAGAVNVYDDISPEKAQAIMFLAGNGSSTASNMMQPRTQVHTPTPKLAAGDDACVNPINTPPYSGFSSPMSVTSHPIGQSGSGSTNNDESMAVKTTGVLTTPVSKVDPPKIVTSLGPVSATTMMPSAVPQARKASLARFLEKRKERAMNSAPYNLSKQSPECATTGSNGMSFSASSGAGSGSLSNNKENSHDI